jgi:hypothetical protein
MNKQKLKEEILVSFDLEGKNYRGEWILLAKIRNCKLELVNEEIKRQLIRGLD